MNSASPYTSSIHLEYIKKCHKMWESKPSIRRIFTHFYQFVADHLDHNLDGDVIEVGCGIGKLKETVPQCVVTDVYPNDWIDRVENIYALNYRDKTLSHIIMIHVLHHLKYPGLALQECHRSLKPGGRLILIEPCLSVYGLFLYSFLGLLTNERFGITKEITLFPKSHDEVDEKQYYAATGNAYRLLKQPKYRDQILKHWSVRHYHSKSYLSYALSGGHYRFQLYPEFFYPIVKKIDSFCDRFPFIFASQSFIVLEKK